MFKRLIIAITLAAAPAAYGAPASYVLGVTDGTLSGPGADVLRKELEHAQFVLYGEDHGFADSPIMLRALAREARPLGFQTLVLEVGPQETQIVASMLKHRGLAGVREMVTATPL